MYRYQKLEAEIKTAIQQGKLRVGEKLPSIRQQCETYGVAKATVIHAYERLEASGWVEARPKSGFFVRQVMAATQSPKESKTVSVPQLIDMNDLMRDIMAQSAAFDITPEPLRRDEVPQGVVEMNRALSRALRQQNGMAHQYYDEPAGLLELREQIAERYHRRGCYLAADDLMVTSGCQHALFLALMACCEPGDVVAVESPGFYGALQLLESLGLQVLEIPVSPQTGISLDSLEAALSQWQIKACIVTPAFATPTGSLMPESYKQRLLSLAEQHDFIIIEDDIYGELSFAQQPQPLKTDDQTDRVILCGSFTKGLSRELRLGWLVAGERYYAKILRLKMVNLLATSRFLQQGLALFIKDGGYDKHLRRLRPQLAQQKDQLVALLAEHWGDLGEIRVSQPKGGLTLWVELPDRYDISALYLEARERGIVITPGNLFTAQDRYRNCLRMSYAHPWNSKRQAALIALAEVIQSSAPDS